MTKFLKRDNRELAWPGFPPGGEVTENATLQAVRGFTSELPYRRRVALILGISRVAKCRALALNN